MSNRSTKIDLWNKDPRCHWCKRVTILTSIPHIKGKANPLMATIDHIFSRYNPARWVRKHPQEKRKVLACYECNHRRSVEETQSLSKTEVVKRSRGFSLSPKGKPPIIKPVATVEEALDRLNKQDKI